MHDRILGQAQPPPPFSSRNHRPCGVALLSVLPCVRDVEDLLAKREIDVSFQTVAEWVAKLGLNFAHRLRRRSRGSFADKWHLDEIIVSIKKLQLEHWRDAAGAQNTPY
ncbi:transposase-like protein [Rhizobium binae]|uniref:Transposase-like protein n=1 Tax=Rhizobium binae TaxID=1138190 RepID=A0ABV2MJ42_9HYPH